MFDNVLYQNQAIEQLKSDIDGKKLPPSILFSGPEYAGKGTAAMELARILCCENIQQQGTWNCACQSCIRHRNLFSPDLLLLGRRRFYEEIAASSDTFLRNPDNEGSKMLFIRSVRKLLSRFNSVLWEDDPRLGKLGSQIGILEEELEDIEAGKAENSSGGPAALQGSSLANEKKKKCESIIKKAAKLENEGLGEFIPIGQIRRAAYWSRLLPLGKHKCIIIENADKMQDGAKNSLLKILEEPPQHLTLILTCSCSMSLLPTMLSRLREYRFSKRKDSEEAIVLSRIFRENKNNMYDNNPIKSYLGSFLPVSSLTLYFTGAFFIASVAAEAVREKKARGEEINKLLIELGKYSAPIAEEGNMGRPADNIKNALEKILGTAEGFEIPGLFIRLLEQCCVLISAWLRTGGDSLETSAEPDHFQVVRRGSPPEKTVWAELWLKELKRSMTENDSFNITPFMALERLSFALIKGMA